MTSPQLPPDPEYDAKYGATVHYHSDPQPQKSIISWIFSIFLGLIGLMLMIPGAACVVSGFGGVLRGQSGMMAMGAMGLVFVAIGMALWRMARRA